MVRIVFDNGELIDCEHISKMYIEDNKAAWKTE